jgi:pyruvate dehydrogenase E1 component alpha subunit
VDHDRVDALLDRDPTDTVQVLDQEGEVVAPELLPAIGDDELLGLYRDMRLVRHFDERMVSLQRQGRVGTFAPAAGQEATQVGSTHALRDSDTVSYQYREHGAVASRGFTPGYVRYWMGHESGTEAIADGNVFPLNIGIAAHLPHAVGASWAFDHRDEDRVVACHFGDGATSEGDFHEGLNFAGVYDVPALFICHNNGWAISTPASEQTASETYAGKAGAYGIDGVRVDGMDPLASYAVTREAAERARPGGDEPGGDASADDPRPVLVEFVEYRFGAHTTADDPTAYREPDDVDPWRALDPLDRMEAFLRETGRIDDEGVAAVRDEADEVVAEAIDAAESVAADPAAMFDHAFAELPREVRGQRDDLLAAVEEHGEEAFLREE